MNKSYVHSLVQLKAMSDETIHSLYHKTEWFIGDGESIEYIYKVIKRWNKKEKEL
jgi:hypothetical protein